MTIETNSTTKKKRSRNGCHNCKKSKIKCDESKPSCSNCVKHDRACDYSIKLTWGGRPYKVPKIEKMNPIAHWQRVNDEKESTSPSLSSPAIKLEENSSGLNQTLSTSKANHSKSKKIQEPTNQTEVEFEKIKVKIEPPSSIETQFEFSKTPAVSSPVMNTDIQSRPLHSAISLEINNNINSLSNVLDNILNEDVFQNHEMMNKFSNSLSPLNSIMGESYDSLNDQNTADLAVNHNNPYINDPTVQPSLYNLMLNNGTNEVSQDNFATPFSPNNNNESFMELMGEYSEDLAKSEAVVSKSGGTIFSIPLRFSSRNQSIAPVRQKRAFESDDEDDEFATASLDDELSVVAVTPKVEEQIQRDPSLTISQESSINTYNQQYINDQSQLVYNNINDHELIPYHNNHTIVSPTLSSSSSEQDVIETIPRGISPLPDILLNVPYYYEHFQFYLNTTAEILIPVHPSIYNNPFKVVLPKLAMSNDILMCLLIAYGISHKSYLKQEEAPKEIVDQLISRTMSELLKLLRDKSTATSDLTLSVVMLLSSYTGTVSKGEKWKIHLKGAKQILLMRGYKKPFAKLIQDMKYLTDNKSSSTSFSMGSMSSNSLDIDGELKESRLLFFMVRWYAFIDVLASLASPLNPTEEMITSYANGKLSLFEDDEELGGDGDSPQFERTYGDPRTASITELKDSPSSSSRSASTITSSSSASATRKTANIDYQLEDESLMSKNILLKSESFSEIDYFLGFNIKFLPLYTKIIGLIEKINITKEYEKLVNNKFTVDPYVITKALEIINKFDKLDYFQSQLNSLNNSNIPESNKDRMRAVIASNHIFALMGKLSIYRRILGISRNSSIIQDICSDSQTAIEKYIPEGSSTDLCGLFPIFVTGCEIMSKKGREFFKSRLQTLGKNASPGAHLGLEVMQKSWDDDCNWYDIFPPDRKTHFIFL